MRGKIKLGVLVSGQGTNLQAILEAIDKGRIDAEVRIVLSNVESAPAVERARQRGVPAVVVRHQDFASREEFEGALIERLEGAGVDVVVLAGFLRLLSPHFVRHYRGRVLNIHPALLPAFPGTHAIEEAWNEGVKVTGVTVHFVDEGTDTGPIVLQEAVQVEEGETLESLTAKIHEVEHRIYPRAIQLCAEGKLKVEGRKVTLGGSP